jgi:mannose-6-phosphate isomerase
MVQFMSENYIFKLKAPLKDYIWGGNKLKSEFGKQTDLKIIAESWELSCHPDGESIIKNGEFKGETLSKVLSDNKSFLGKNCDSFEKFPMLIKLIDANDKLSIQVHPEDDYANRFENGEYGKTEVWYIVDAEPNAKLIYGFNKTISKDELKKAITDNTLSEIVNFVPVKKGDVFFIPAGLVHAICEGILICEIQQNSNTTYRVYDWGRLDANGNSRELHINKALDVSKLEGETQTDFSLLVNKIGENSVATISECKYFKSYKYDILNSITLNCDENSFHTITFLEGAGEIKNGESMVTFSKGTSLFIPANTGDYSIFEKCEFILSKV